MSFSFTGRRSLRAAHANIHDMHENKMGGPFRSHKIFGINFACRHPRFQNKKKKKTDKIMRNDDVQQYNVQYSPSRISIETTTKRMGEIVMAISCLYYTKFKDESLEMHTK